MKQEFKDLPDFVERHLKRSWQKKVYNSQHNIWCAQWWAHPEATLRLRTLWQYYEAVTNAADPVGLAQWVAYMDQQMEILTSPNGCFRECTPTHKELTNNLITTAQQTTTQYPGI